MQFLLHQVTTSNFQTCEHRVLLLKLVSAVYRCDCETSVFVRNDVLKLVCLERRESVFVVLAHSSRIDGKPFSNISYAYRKHLIAFSIAPCVSRRPYSQFVVTHRSALWTWIR